MIALEKSIIQEVYVYDVTVSEYVFLHSEGATVTIELKNYKDTGYISSYNIEVDDKQYQGMIGIVNTLEESLLNAEKAILKKINELS